jgi:hypothetical protein
MAFTPSCLIDRQHLLHALAALAGLDHATAIGWTGAIPEPLAGILAHRARCMLPVLGALVLVKDREHLTQDLRRAVSAADILGNRNQIDTRLAQPADVVLADVDVARKSTGRMHQDHVEGMGTAGRRLDHALEGGTVLVGARQTCVLKHVD